uniref:Uncharacterized protein n=1 Tax=Mustela putorius furo TaxID=9669 RepID=M3Z6H2_MUSPF
MNVFPSHPNSERPPSGRGAPAPSPLGSSPALAFLCAVAGPGWARQAALAPLAWSPPRPLPVLARSKVAKVPLAAPCTPVPRAQGGRAEGGGWASAGSCGPGPHIWNLHLSGRRPATAPTAQLGPPVGARGPAVPRLARPGPSPGAHKGSPSLALPGRCTISGSPPPFLAAGRRSRVETKARRRRRGDKGAGGGGRGAHQSAALSSRITSSYAASSSRRWPLKLTPAMLLAGPRPNGQTHRRTDVQWRREGKKESPPPPPRSLCSVASGASQRPGEGSRPAGGGGRRLRPARSLRALGPSAALARPRGRAAPPSRPAPGRPHAPHPPPLRAAPRSGSALPLPRRVSPTSQTLAYRVPDVGAHPLPQPHTPRRPHLTKIPVCSHYPGPASPLFLSSC